MADEHTQYLSGMLHRQTLNDEGRMPGRDGNVVRSSKMKKEHMKWQRQVKNSKQSMVGAGIKSEPTDVDASFRLEGWSSSNLVQVKQKLSDKVMEEVFNQKQQEDLQTVFHVKEADWEIEKRIVASQEPLPSLALEEWKARNTRGHARKGQRAHARAHAHRLSAGRSTRHPSTCR